MWDNAATPTLLKQQKSTDGRNRVDFSLLIRHRLRELGREQRDLAAAAQVTESYISQLLTGKKAPPAPERTDIYDKMETFLRLPAGKLSTLAAILRTDALKRKLADPPTPLFKEVRELILDKCAPGSAKPVRAMFEKEPFGALERLVTQKLLDVVKRVTKEELGDENWLRLVARLTDRSYQQVRVMVLEFLETDIFNVSVDNCVTFLDPLIESWDIDLATFGMEIVLNHRLASGHPKRFEFVEREPAPPVDEEPGLQAFLQDPSLRGDATTEEIEFLKKLPFTRRRPTPLYYYRELQNLRDPLHFRRASTDEEIT
jgi:transcriptional regulator with XRE-family HTH domain